jgi:transposase
LPGNAPELNPDEGIWAYVKYVELRNVCSTDLDDLHRHFRLATARGRHKRTVIRGCVTHCSVAL